MGGDGMTIERLMVAVYPNDPDECATHIELVLSIQDGLTANLYVGVLSGTSRVGYEYLPLSQHEELDELHDGQGWALDCVQAFTGGYLEARQKRRQQQLRRERRRRQRNNQL
jgi:hypothetical protein